MAAVVAALLGGAGAVGAEVVFTRKLALLFGVTAPAAATVVAVYMAGMALGSAWGGRLADRLGAKVVTLYVGAELFGAAWAASFPWLFDLADAATLAVPLEQTLLFCGMATGLLVGPAAIASGATFPALTRLAGQERWIRLLYAANAGGAALGGLVAGIWLPGALGLTGTLWLAAALMLSAGGIVAIISRIQDRAAPDAPAVRPAPTDPVGVGWALAAYAAIGGLGMGAEIGWTRLMEQTGPNPGALCFPVVLSAYLVGLAIGGTLLSEPLRALGERRALG
ncbi:MAG: hypothetical protein AAFV53_34430, partial [Myxococcota bacterium]